MNKTATIIVIINVIIVAVFIIYGLEFSVENSVAYIYYEKEGVLKPIPVHFVSFTTGTALFVISMVILNVVPTNDGKSFQYTRLQSNVLVLYIIAVLFVMTAIFVAVEKSADDIDKKTLKYMLTAIILSIVSVVYLFLRIRINKMRTRQILDDI